MSNPRARASSTTSRNRDSRWGRLSRSRVGPSLLTRDRFRSANPASFICSSSPLSRLRKEIPFIATSRIPFPANSCDQIEEPRKAFPCESEVVVLEIKYPVPLGVSLFHLGNHLVRMLVRYPGPNVAWTEQKEQRCGPSARDRHEADGSALKRIPAGRKIGEVGGGQGIKGKALPHWVQNRPASPLKAQIGHILQIAVAEEHFQQFDERTFSFPPYDEIHAFSGKRAQWEGGHVAPPMRMGTCILFLIASAQARASRGRR